MLTRSTFASILGAACLAGCASEPASSCERARDIVEECTGERPDAVCTADGEQQYQDIVTEYDSNGCTAFAAGKSDGFFCSLLDVFGACKDPVTPLFGDQTGAPTKYPILLAHGFNTSTTNFWRFNNVDKALRADGHKVALGSVPPFDTPQVRAAFLSQQIDDLMAATGAHKVNLICFSMGGLDCRYLASPNGLDRGASIASITMISSPNHGSGIADATLGFLPGADHSKLVDALASMWGLTFSDVAANSHLVAALQAMSERDMPHFNQTTPDAPGVIYESWAGFSHVGGATTSGIEQSIAKACRDSKGVTRMYRHAGTRDKMDPLLVASAAFVSHFDVLHPSSALPNDGVSTVESAKWGTFRGCFPADHLDQVGQVNDGGMDKNTGFDYLNLYRKIAFDLAARGL
jgi:triacylglycerol lipase